LSIAARRIVVALFRAQIWNEYMRGRTIRLSTRSAA
jgi:hypothetical protein